MRRLFDVDPLSGARTYFTYEHATDTVRLETEEEVSPVLDANEAFRQLDSGNWRGDMHLVASIPLVIANDLQRRGILQNKKKLRAWLCDRDNMKLRTKEGKI